MDDRMNPSSTAGGAAASARPGRSSAMRDAAPALWGSIAALVRRIADNASQLAGDVARDAAAIARDAERLAEAARAEWAAWQSAGRAAPRIARVVGECAQLLALYRWYALRARVGGFDHVPEAAHQVLAARARAICAELRGGVLKIGQLASCRPDLVGPIWARELAQLQDRVPPVDGDQVVARIEAELGAPLDALFAEFTREPIAAASLAQVHCARLADGRDVAVKVQVPGIAEIIEADIVALRALATVGADTLGGIDLAGFASELGASLARELDYTAEAAASRAIAREVVAPLFVPGVIDSHSRGGVLTFEHVSGARLSDHLATAAPAERARVIGALVDGVARQVFIHGQVHADPHPGNFLVTPDGGIAMLDFGAVLRLSPAERRGYARILGAVFSGDTDAAASALAELGFAGDRAALLAIARLVCDAMRPGVAAAAIDWSAQLDQIIAEAAGAARAGGVVVPPGFVLLGRVLATVAGLIVTYKPPLELFRLIGPHVAAAVTGAV